MFRWHVVLPLILAPTLAIGGEPGVALSQDVSATPTVAAAESTVIVNGYPQFAEECRGLFQSDRCFPGFVAPISNPVLAKDPRSNTEVRFLFLNNWFPNRYPLGADSAQLYGLQVRLALTERLTFIADKDGLVHLGSGNGAPAQTGWANVAAGLKYTFYRDVENQFLMAAGLMFEPQTGESKVFQGHGDGLFTGFLAAGKEFGECNHAIVNLGYQLPVDGSENSSFWYASLHLDRQMLGWLYPLVELNWFHYTSDGSRGIPVEFGEGDGLINLGTTGVDGRDIVTGVVGVKALLLDGHVETGVAYERALSPQRDLIGDRVLFELILRY